MRVRFVKRRRVRRLSRWWINWHELVHGGVTVRRYGLTRATLTCSCGRRRQIRAPYRWRVA